MRLNQLLTGLILGFLVGGGAWRMKALTLDGALAAAILGGLVFGLGGVPWATLLLAFFLSSSALSKSFRKRKTGLDEKFSKTGGRDWAQVAANGGLGALFVAAQALFPGQTWPWLAFAGAMASVNADTWGTELGVLNKTPPRLITSGKAVEKGTSGGISLAGTLASLAGAALIGGLAAIFPLQAGVGSVKGSALFFTVIALSGLFASLLDSLLGATVQAIYTCPACDKETERHRQHTCGTLTHQVRGWAWLNNDLVNLLASLAGAAFSAGAWLLLR